LNAGNVADAIRRVRPYAVDVSGGVEAAVGIKDAVKLTEFIQETRKFGSGSV
jgi:phosphoribosylanthranilate isomerase